jgi:enoyl-CoA hydratase
MDQKIIHLEIADGVGLLTIRRPEALNALNIATFDQINEALTQLEKLQGLRCLVITGEGKAFVAGADIAEMQHMNSDEAFRFSAYGQKTFQRLEDFPVPVIAAINGFALGGGLELALSCDIRLASDKARFGQPEVNLGLIPGFGGSQRLPALLAHGDALFLLCTGEMINAEEALRMRLIYRIVPHDDLLNQAMAVAKTIAGRGPESVRMVKKAVHSGIKAGAGNGFLIERELFSHLFATDSQGHEGMDAFLEKRQPSW